MNNCTASGCTKPARANKKYCSRHAEQLRRHGEITNIKPSYRDPNQIEVSGDVAHIQLLNKSGDLVATATIDASMVSLVAKYKWHLKNTGHVACRCKAGTFYLHRLVTGATDGVVIDHADRDPLNNRLSNLRACTQSENTANQSGSRNSKTKHKGVHPFKGGPRYAAQITHKRKVHHLGVFDTVTEAKAAYDAKALELFGEFAVPPAPTSTKPKP